MQQIMVEYFTTWFQSSITDGRLANGDTVLTIYANHKQSLIMHVTEMEVKAIVFSMYPEKSPELNGLNPALFHPY